MHYFHQKTFTRLTEHFFNLIQWMNGAGVIWVFMLMFFICADITGRTLFDFPLQGVPEIVSFSLTACVFLQLAFAVQNSRLTQVEFLFDLVQKNKPRSAQGLQLFFSTAGCLVFVAIALGAWPDFFRAFRTSEFAGVEGIYTFPVWPIKLVVFLGAVVAALGYLRQLIRKACKSKDENSPNIEKWVIVFSVIGLCALIIATIWEADFHDRTIGIIAITAVLVLILLGMPIAIALLLSGFAGLGLLKKDFGIATDTLSLASQGAVSEYVFATVPLFVLMGLFVSVSEIGQDAFKAAQRAFGKIRGGLGVATVAANAIFAAITGISIASAAIFSKIAVPEMVRRGYTPRFSVGLTAGSSVLGMLIPPSLLLIIYGVIAEVSIGALFIAAIVPGILLAFAFALGTVLMAWLWPEFVGNVIPEEHSDISPKHPNTSFSVLPVFLLIVLVLGGIYGGIFTPTEAGAAGAFGAMCIALAKQHLTWKKLWTVIGETGQVTVTILFLIISASTFSRMLTLTGLPSDMAAYLGGIGLGLGGFLVGYLLLLVLLGTVLDSTSILLILLPLVLPAVAELGGNLVWFGIVTVIGVEIGLLTPPLGLSVYVIKTSLDDKDISLGTIFSGSFPFVLITLTVTIILMAFPRLSLLFL